MNTSSPQDTLGEEKKGLLEEKKVLQGKERFHVTPLPFLKSEKNDLGRPYGRRIGYLEGLRGIFTIFAFLAIFFRICAPAIQTDTDVQGNMPAAFIQPAPAWQNVLRKTLSPLFWNSTLTPHFFIILSGRVILQTYLERRNSIPLAGAAFRRPFRLLGPALFGLTFASILNVTGAFQPGIIMAQVLQSDIGAPARIWGSALEYWNSIAAFFFAGYEFSYYDRAFAFIPPAGVDWILPIIFQQTYTCITLAYILPYTRLQAKVIGYLSFGLICYWVGSWTWYSITGLLLCEFSIVYSQLTPSSFPLRFRQKGRTFRIPLWIPPFIVFFLGVVQKYLWVSFPSYRNHEYIAHTDILTAGLVRDLNPGITPYPRIDDWMVITGLLVLVEIVPRMQSVLDNDILKHFGRLSFSVMMTSGSIYASLGAYIRNTLTLKNGINDEATILAVQFFTCAPLAFFVAELAHWTSDVGTMMAARWFFSWMRKP